MSVINPNPTDKANIQAKIDEQKAIIAGADAAIKDIDTVQFPTIASKDATNQKFYNKQNDIIVNYELESKALNGVYLLNPITEADLTNIQSGRLWANQATELIRIPEFDGNGPTGTAADYYIAKLAALVPAVNRLKNGLITSTSISGPVTSTVNSASTTFTSTTNLYPLLNKEFVMASGSKSFIGLVTGVIDDGFPPMPASTYTATFTFVTTLNAGDSISGGSFIGTFTGFSNADRAVKATSPDRQQIMNFYISILNANIATAQTLLGTQKTAIAANNDPNIGNVATLVQQEIDFFAAYLPTLDISDVGIALLTSNVNGFTTRANNRIAEIPTKKAAYYNKRYFWAVERSGSGGTITQQWRAELSRASAVDRKAKAQAKLDTLLAGVT